MKNIIPELSSAEARKNFTSNLEPWRNFAQRITKNPFVKTFLLKRDGAMCSWCHRDLREIQIIHHTSYDHWCSYNKVLRIGCSTKNRPNKTRIIPDCKGCKEENDDRFLNCMDKLTLVHRVCNKKISEAKSIRKEVANHL